MLNIMYKLFLYAHDPKTTLNSIAISKLSAPTWKCLLICLVHCPMDAVSFKASFDIIILFQVVVLLFNLEVKQWGVQINA